MSHGPGGFMLANIEILLFVVAVITTIVKLRKASARHEVMTTAYTLWGELLFYCVGIGFVYLWFLHAFFGRTTAALIGWRSSPFQWELAWAELGLAVVAMLSLWRGYEMRLAATLMFAIFAFGAAAQHIQQLMHRHNYAPGNAGLILWFGELALPLFILVLAVASRDAYERTMRRPG
jgi:hypothetical protein